jgi:hypothetical protein
MVRNKHAPTESVVAVRLQGQDDQGNPPDLPARFEYFEHNEKHRRNGTRACASTPAVTCRVPPGGHKESFGADARRFS